MTVILLSSKPWGREMTVLFPCFWGCSTCLQLQTAQLGHVFLILEPGSRKQGLPKSGLVMCSLGWGGGPRVEYIEIFLFCCLDDAKKLRYLKVPSLFLSSHLTKLVSDIFKALTTLKNVARNQVANSSLIEILLRIFFPLWFWQLPFPELPCLLILLWTVSDSKVCLSMCILWHIYFPLLTVFCVRHWRRWRVGVCVSRQREVRISI